MGSKDMIDGGTPAAEAEMADTSLAKILASKEFVGNAAAIRQIRDTQAASISTMQIAQQIADARAEDIQMDPDRFEGLLVILARRLRQEHDEKNLKPEDIQALLTALNAQRIQTSENRI